MFRRHGLKAITVAALAALTFIAMGESAAHAATQPFAVQAREAGLSIDQAARLQTDVVANLAAIGGTQVSANEILYPNGGARLVLALPGQRTHGLSQARTDEPPNWACGFYTFCAFQYQNYDFNGAIIEMYYCGYYWIPWVGTGSWVNKQTDGTRAFIYFTDGTIWYTTDGAYSWNNNQNWTPVGNVKNC